MIEIAKNHRFMKSLHLKCLFYYFKLCGLAPINLNVNAIDNTKVIRWSFTRTWIGIVYNLLLICCTVVWNYFSFCIIYFKDNTKFTFDQTVYMIVDLYSIFNTLCIILIFSFQQKQLLTLFNKLNDMRETIKFNNDSIYEGKRLFHKIMTLLVINIPIWIILIATITTFHYEPALMFTGLSFCIFVRNAMTLQYCMNLKLIEHLLYVLNRNLSILSTCFNSPHNIESIDTVDNKVSQLWEWYSLLCKMSRIVSDFYSFPMLLNIQCEFLMTITIIYYVLKPIVYGISSSMEYVDYINSLSFALTHLCPIILLTTSVSKVINESQRTREIVNDYVKEPKARMVKEKLLHFSIYLLNNNIAFSVFDLFPLDGTLLVMIAGSVATYLVILLQFQSQPAATFTN